MTEEAKQHIKDSWEKAVMIPNVIDLFYNRLFELAPDVRKLFPEDMSRQSEKLATMLAMIVSNLDRMDEIKGSIEDLGRVHNRLNIPKSSYPYVSEALVDTLKKGLGTDYKPEIGDAWQEAMSNIAEIMVNAPKERKRRFSLLNKLFGK